jgi:uncharacterized membrane protein required for colicin V production
VQHLDGHIPTLVNYFVYTSYNALFIIVWFLCSFVRSLFHPILLFIVRLFTRKYSVLTLDCIPGILIPLYINHHHLCKSTNIIHQTAPSLS